MKTYSQTISLSGRRKKKLEKQVEKYLSALKSNRNDPKLHIELGDTYALLEEARNSVKAYYSAIDLLRQSPSPGKLRNLMVELYEKIINIAPNEYKAYIDLSEEYIAAGQKERAFRFLLSSAKKAYESENYELALQCYTQAIAKGRTNPHIVERCTELYLKLGRKEEAMQNYIQIGDAYAQEEKNIEALEYYKKACALDKDNPELILKIARMYNAMAWTENAASELVRVGEYYEKERDFTEALRYYRYSVRLDPENEKAQEGKRRITEAYGADGIPLTDMEEIPPEDEVQDVLEELDRIEDTMEADFTRTGEFEITPIDEDATLTLEGIEDVEGDSGQSDQLEPELLPPDEGVILDLEENESPEMGFGQPIPSEPEILSMDLDTMLAIEGSQSSEELSSGEQESVSASSISLEDWIIDLKEDELVELAFEKALKEQEMPPAEAGPASIWSGEGVQDESPEQQPSLLPLPASAEQAEDDLEQAESEQVEGTEVEKEGEWFIGFTGDTNEVEEQPEQILSEEEEVAESFGAITKEEEGAESFEATPEVAEQPEHIVSEEEEGAEFFEATPEVAEQPEHIVSEEEEGAESFEATPEVAEQPEYILSEEEEVVSFLEDTVGIEEELEQAQAEEEEAVSFLENTAEVRDQFDQSVRNNIIELRRKIDDLEQRLQRTEEEKYFLQERFAAQISRHKSHEESLQKEIADVYKDKEELEKQLRQTSVGPLTDRKGLEKFDDARYEALVAKIQSKKVLLQHHLSRLLKKRQENGRFLTEELNNLNATKQRLQNNLEYIQRIKARIEEKVNTELLQAKLEIQSFSETTRDLENKLRAQQLVEQNLQKQFNTLTKEKEVLQENYTKSMNVLAKEKATLEKQVQQASQAKKAVERILRNKLQGLHQSYQQLKTEYKTALSSKEAQINESAQRLNEFTDKYVKLERTLAEIRKERDKFNTMLAQETATREKLEEKLINIESQVDSLETQGTKLLTQLGQELDRHFDVEQSVSDKFQLSFEELEGLLALQEKEIQSLEAL